MTGPACFDDADAAHLVTGAVDTATRDRLNAHADVCPACHRRVVTAAQALVSRGTSVVDWDDAPLAPGAPSADPTRGHTVAGRYVVLDVLGSGGMGTVYLAHDAVLRREVALKLTRRETPLSLAALQHEARAIAAVRHAHVVTVFDLAIDDGRVAIAMEYVRGPTLRTWLATRRPPRRRVLAPLLAMGEGLEAAHAAGVVHGDVKLDNALVGEDGAVRLADFGLARLGGGTGARGPTGGTLAYLAPEVAAGNAADAASDQFAFAASCVEAFAGRRPAVERGERWVDAPLEACPRWLRAPLRRGLAPDPRGRHPSVAALLGALRRRRASLRLALALALAALIAAPWLIASHVEARAVAQCLDDARASIPRTLTPPDLGAAPHAQARFARAERYHGAGNALTTWAERWMRQQERLCRSEVAEPSETATLLARCLAFERAWTRQLVQRAEGAESGSPEAEAALDQLVVRASDFVCDDPEALGVFELAASDAELGDAATLLGGRADTSVAELDALVTRLEPLGPSRILGWALLRRGGLRLETQGPAAARPDLERALHLAQRLRDREVEAEAWGLLAEGARQREGGLGEAEFYLANARAVAYRLTRSHDDERRGEVAATLALASGRPDEALAAARLALERQRATGRGTARTLAMVGGALLELGRLDEAETAFREALALRRRMHDGDHTRTAGALHNLALLELARGRFPEARELAAEALRMRRAVLPEDHAETARVALTLARLDVEVEGDALALGRAREAASRLGGSFGSSHFEAIRAELLVADLALATGDLEQAAARVGPAWEKMVRENMANGPILAEALLIEADLAWRAGDATRARRLLEQIRGAAGHPLDGPWVCPRFAALAALVGAPGVRCPDLPIAPRSETARLRGALAGAQK